jgi:hypothetical protein
VAWLAVNGHEVGSTSGSSTGGSAIQFRMHVDRAVVGWTLAHVLILGVSALLTKTLRHETFRSLQ